MLLDYNVYLKNLQDIDLGKTRIINTINPHSYCESKKDVEFATALKASDILLPDGIGIVLAEKLLNKNKIQKIAGFDIFKFLMNDMNTKKGTVFFLGASQNTLQSIREKILRLSRLPNRRRRCDRPRCSRLRNAESRYNGGR